MTIYKNDSIDQSLKLKCNEYIDWLKSMPICYYTNEDELKIIKHLRNDNDEFISKEIADQNAEIINYDYCNFIIKTLIKEIGYVFNKKQITTKIMRKIENYIFKYEKHNIIDKKFVVNALEECGGFKYVNNKYTITEDELLKRNIIISSDEVEDEIENNV